MFIHILITAIEIKIENIDCIWWYDYRYDK